jgi:serine/threonine protein kinase
VEFIESEPIRVPHELLEHPRYRVVKVLGAGGMGVVFQAEHRIMERPVALKVIHPKRLSSPAAVERFRQEVRAAGKLLHQNIVTAHDAEQAGDWHFLVMEFVDGVSLAEHVMARGPLPVMDACRCIRQVALGLHHAFGKGMVHRDIKPQNLMLSRSGQIKILDFGLARFAHPQSAPTEADEDRRGQSAALTSAGATLGTPDYMAPEQAADSREADIRADIYSLGCTFYFLLTGWPPFPAGSSVDKLLAHAHQTPLPLTDLRPDVPSEVLVIVERMMAKDPKDRFQTPKEAAEALAPLCRPGSPPTAATADPPAITEPAPGAAPLDLADLPDPLGPPLSQSVGLAPWVRPKPRRSRLRQALLPFQRWLNRH